MFLVIVDGLALLLLFLNVVLLAAVHARRVRQYFRTRRAKRFRARVEEVFDEFDPATRARAPGWLRAQIGEFDELERPIAATMLIEGMKAASEEERAPDVLRDAGVLDSLTRSSSRGARMASSARDPNARLDRRGRIGSRPARAPHGSEPARAGVCGSRSRPDRGTDRPAVVGGAVPRLLEAPLGDEAAAVRTAAAESLGRLGGERLPEALARATHDEQATVRCAATSALGSFDDPSGVKLAADALLDPDRETAVRAGESLVRLTELGRGRR